MTYDTPNWSTAQEAPPAWLFDAPPEWMNEAPPPEEWPDFDTGEAFDPETGELATAEGKSIEATPYQWRDPSTIPPRPWIWGHWMLRGVVATVVATGGTGKTTFLCGAAMSLVTGRDLLGKAVWHGHKRVWIWNLEDPLEEMQRSIQATALHYGLGPDDIDGRLFVDTAMEGKGLCTAINGPHGFKLLSPVYDQITAELKRREIDVLIVDPFVSSHEVEENDNSKIDAIAKAWGRVANAAGCAVVLVHHTSKAGAGEVTTMSARGGKSLTDATRIALVLNRMDEATAKSHGFDDRERRRHFTVGDDKHNRAPADKASWFRLESVDLGNGGNLRSDSVAVAVPWKLPDPFEGMTLDDLYRVQCKVAEGQYRADPQAAAWAGHAVAEVMGLDADRDKNRIKQLLKEWTGNRAFVEVQLPDEQRKPRKFLKVGKWANDLSAPPHQGGAAQGGAVGNKQCATTTPTLSGGWCGAVTSQETDVAHRGAA